MPTEKEWASMSKKERAAYADAGAPGGTFSGKDYPEYGIYNIHKKGYSSLRDKASRKK